MGNDSTPGLPKQDQVLQSLFAVCTMQIQNTMRLCHALRNDPGVSPETVKAAEEAFGSVEAMLDEMDKISMAAWGRKSTE